MKYIINGKEFICDTNNPHGYMRELLIDAQLDDWDGEEKEG